MPKLKLPEKMFREGVIDEDSVRVLKEDEEGRTLEMSFSSENPVRRWFGQEVLGHKRGEADLSRLESGRAPLLADHRADLENTIGVVERVWIKDRVGRAVVRFRNSEKANEVLDGIRDGALSCVSVGYRINDLLLVEDSEEKGRTYRATDWTPFEVSMVAIPADMSVGVGRAHALEMPDPATLIHEVEVRTMSKDDIKENTETGKRSADTDPAPAPAAAATIPAEPVDTAAIERTAEEKARKEFAEITAMGAQFDMRDEAEKAIAAGKTPDEFQRIVLEKLASRSQTEERVEDSRIGMSNRDMQQFSFLRLMRAQAFGQNRPEFIEAAKFEMECSRAAADKYDVQPQGYLIPADILREPLANFGALGVRQAEWILAGGPVKRDLVVGIPTAGGNLVATDLLASSFIDLLRNRMMVVAMGATMLTDLQGNVDIPRQSGAGTFEWVAENTAPAETEQTIDQVPLTPRTAAAFTDYSRRLLLQSSIDIEAFVRSDLMAIIGLGLDLSALYGTGGTQPQGIVGATGVGKVTFAAADPDFSEIVDLETEVANANADVGALGYMMDAAMRGALKTTEKAVGTAQFIWEQGNTVNGYRTGVTNQVTDGDVIFGNWSDLIMGMWSGIDILVDPFTGSAAATTRVTAHQDADIALRHGESFALGNDTP